VSAAPAAVSAAPAAGGRGEGLPAALLALGALVLYLATLSRQPSADGLAYVWATDHGDWSNRVDPYHVFLHPLMWAWARLWEACGWRGGALLPLQILNAAGGALSVALLYAIVARLGRSRRAAALAAAGCAVSGGLWLMSTEPEGVALPLPVHLALLALLLRLEPGEPRRPARAFGLGLALGLATLAYLTFALLLPLALLVLWQGRERPIAPTAALIAGFLLPVVPAALSVAAFHASIADFAEFYRGYAGDERYGVPAFDSLPRGLYAFLRMLVLYPGLGINDRTLRFLADADGVQRAAWAATYAAVALVAAAPPWLAWRHRREWDPLLRQRLGLWLALYAGFAFYWVPSDLEFWLPVGIGWFLLAGLLLARGHLSPWLASAAVLLLLVLNARNLILPHRREPLPQPGRVELSLRATGRCCKLRHST